MSIDGILCSFRQNLEVCILEIKQVQKHFNEGCKNLKQTMSSEDIDNFSPNIRTIEKELKKEDDYLEALLGISLPEEQIVKVCEEAEKTDKSSGFIENYITYKQKKSFLHIRKKN